MRNTEEAQNKEYKIDYLYKLLTIFGVVSKFACGMFPTVGKVTHCQNYWTCCTVPTCSKLPIEFLLSLLPFPT